MVYELYAINFIFLQQLNNVGAYNSLIKLL